MEDLRRLNTRRGHGGLWRRRATTHTVRGREGGRHDDEGERDYVCFHEQIVNVACEAPTGSPPGVREQAEHEEGGAEQHGTHGTFGVGGPPQHIRAGGRMRVTTDTEAPELRAQETGSWRLLLLRRWARIAPSQLTAVLADSTVLSACCSCCSSARLQQPVHRMQWLVTSTPLFAKILLLVVYTWLVVLGMLIVVVLLLVLLLPGGSRRLPCPLALPTHGMLCFCAWCCLSSSSFVGACVCVTLGGDLSAVILRLRSASVVAGGAALQPRFMRRFVSMAAAAPISIHSLLPLLLLCPFCQRPTLLSLYRRRHPVRHLHL